MRSAAAGHTSWRLLYVLSSTASALAVVLWLGGLGVLGALVAPVVFSVAPMPQSADAMTIIFRRFDIIAMTCAAVVLAVEALHGALRLPLGRLGVGRVAAAAAAALLATYEGASISPQIAELHATGAVRGMGAAGRELARLHQMAELCGKVELILLVALVGLQVASWARPRPST